MEKKMSHYNIWFVCPLGGSVEVGKLLKGRGLVELSIMRTYLVLGDQCSSHMWDWGSVATVMSCNASLSLNTHTAPVFEWTIGIAKPFTLRLSTRAKQMSCSWALRTKRTSPLYQVPNLGYLCCSSRNRFRHSLSVFSWDMCLYSWKKKLIGYIQLYMLSPWQHLFCHVI